MADLHDDFHPGDSQKRAIGRIHAFLRAPGLPSGGVLLVTGPRGAGKTRLVDQALLRPAQISFSFCPVFRP